MRAVVICPLALEYRSSITTDDIFVEFTIFKGCSFNFTRFTLKPLVLWLGGSPPATKSAAAALAENGVIQHNEAGSLDDSYSFLRLRCVYLG